MKRISTVVSLAAALLLTGPVLCAQEVLQYEVIDGDTVFVDNIEPAKVFSFRKQDYNFRQLRKYYRTVYNFNAVYPYALVGRKMMAQVDSIVAAENLSKGERARYVNQVEKELFRLFEDDIRQMTISKGFVLVKLIDRECGRSAYEIILDYENRFSADFWNLVGKIFSQNLKGKYDPEGEDAHIEEMVRIWEDGYWNEFYYYIFGKEPPVTVIGTDRISVRPKN